MSSKPWFKFFPGDYLGDTRRLSQREHGAYLLLLLDYYANGKPPPDDDLILARITLSASPSDWAEIRLAIQPYFEIRAGLWQHARANAEINSRKNAQKAFSDGARKTNRIRWDKSPSESLSVSHTRSQMSEPDRSKEKTKPKNSFALPDFIPLDHWSAFVEMRQKIRKPLTDYAKRLAVRKLKNLQEQGHPPAQVLMQSAFNSWAGLFPVKEIK